MIVVTENRKLKVSSAYRKIEKDDCIIFKNEYGVTRLIVRKEKLVAYGNGIDNKHDKIEVIQ